MWPSRRGRSDSSGAGATNGASSIFGAPLDVAIRRRGSSQQQQPAEVPDIVRQICEHLSKAGLATEGLFRVNGNNRMANQIRRLFDEHSVVDFSDIHDVHSIASVLKQYIRELPDGIVDSEATLQFVQAAEAAAGDPNRLCRDYAELIDRLPEPNRKLLKYLTEFLRRVADRDAENKMSPLNLGICFGPNVFRCGDTVQSLKVQSMANKIMSDLIAHYSDVFEPAPQAKLPRMVTVKECSGSGGAGNSPSLRRLSAGSTGGGGGGGHSMTNNNSSHSSSSESAAVALRSGGPQPKPRNSLQPTLSASTPASASAGAAGGASMVSSSRVSLVDDEPSSYSESPRFPQQQQQQQLAAQQQQQLGLLQQPGGSLSRAIRAAVASHLFGAAADEDADDDGDEDDDDVEELPRDGGSSGGGGGPDEEEESERTLTPKATPSPAVPRLDLSQLTAGGPAAAATGTGASASSAGAPGASGSTSVEARRSVYDNVGSLQRPASAGKSAWVIGSLFFISSRSCS
ncbi:hypothetical protein BOX15_Mlig020964g3 [Macrostomum lignano]|uniref:Rho-GAP domain-containing protein n=1 Tax=Macrostomum lignano TaxID=282301 RepID=A0A267E088_9PLAT|nr:hypothetical protein BOX15_Mlig020964g3 [Macrostomum lignano]